MALPLPNVVSDVGPGGGVVSSMRGANALSSDMLGNVIKGAQAQYAPYQSYGNAFLTNQEAQWTPYKYQMQALANPLLWMAAQSNPQLQQQISKMMANPLQIANGVNVPPPALSRSTGILNNIMSLIQGRTPANQSQNPMAASMASNSAQPNANPMSADAINGASPVNQNALQSTPAQDANNNGQSVLAPGGTQGVINKMTQPYVQQPYTPGTTISTGNGPVSVADASAVQASQQAIQGIKNLKPILQDISKGAEKWLAPGEKGKIAIAQLLSSGEQWIGDSSITNGLLKEFGVTRKDISDYAEWNAQKRKAVETIMKARQWPQDSRAIDQVSDIINPVPGEGKEYGERVSRELAQLEQQLLPNYQSTLSGGFPLSGGNNGSATNTKAPLMTVREAIEKDAKDFKNQIIIMSGPDPKDHNKIKTWRIPQGQAQTYLENGFKRAK